MKYKLREKRVKLPINDTRRAMSLFAYTYFFTMNIIITLLSKLVAIAPYGLSCIGDINDY